jgi:flagellin
VVSIGDKSLQQRLEKALERSTRENSDAMEKLSSGSVFTRLDPRPSERALAEGLSQKIRGLSAAKRNINDAVSLLQTADSSMQQINDMIMRMKEINVAATNTTINDHERKFLFIEYQALHDEIQRVAETTVFNGVPILNGDSEDAPERLIFRVGDPVLDESSNNEDDINTIVFEGLRDVVATPNGLGLQSAADFLSGQSMDEGISVNEAKDLMAATDENFATAYDQAIGTLSTMRAVYGGMQARMQRALDYTDVLSENLSAARSTIADTDYASEVARMASSRVLMQAGTAVLAQSGFTSSLSVTLLNSLFN